MNRPVRLNYYQELTAQIQVNEEQLDRLEDQLFIQRIKSLFYLGVATAILAILLTIVAMLLSSNRFELVDRYTTLINIGAIFLFFGLIETFSFFISSLSLLREVKRLIRRQEMALKEARTEFAVA